MKDTTPDAELEDLVATCLGRMEDEGSAALEALCAEHPLHAAALRRRVGLLLSTSLVDARAAGARLPTRLGDFELRGLLGAGAMGVVHVAWQRSVGREVAVKLVRPELLLFPASRARFEREVLLVARLRHPAILPILAVGEEGGVPWYATELVHGCSLAELLQRLRARFGSARAIEPAEVPGLVAGGGAPPGWTGEPWRPPRTWRELALGMALELARALAHAHGRGVLHRDVKPSNVLCSSDGRVFLADFGLAAAAADPIGEGAEGGGDPALTRTGTAVGSLPYLAPELLEGRPADVRSDVYGLGALLHELLTLRRPYEEASPTRLVARILAGDRPPPRRLEPALGADDEAVLQRALERSPDARYPTASAFAEDLEALLARRPTQARPAGPGLRLLRLVQRRPAASLAGVLAVLLVAGGPLGLALVEGRARGRLERKNEELDAALAREGAERERAQANLSRAVRAVELMLRRTGESLLEEVPQMQRVRTELLQSALELYGDLLPQSPSDPALVLEAAALRQAAGDARLGLGEPEAARVLLAEGLALLEGCAGCRELDPRRTDLLTGELMKRLGELEADRDPARATELLHEAFALLGGPTGPGDPEETLLAGLALAEQMQRSEDPEEARALLDELATGFEAARAGLQRSRGLMLSAKLRAQRGTLLHLLGDHAAAADDLRAACAELDELVGLESDSAHARLDREIASINLSAVLLKAGDLDGAAAALAVARADGEWLAQAFPDSEAILRKLAGVVVNEGLVLYERGDAAGCRAAWEHAIELGRPLAGRPRPSGESLLQLGLALGNLADLDLEEQRVEEALERADEAEDVLARAHALAPRDGLVARCLEFSRITRGSAWALLGEPAEARADLEAAERVAPLDPFAQRALASGWMRLAEAAPAEAGQCRARALDALRRAADLGWEEPAAEEDPLLAPLRDDPRFPWPGPGAAGG